PVPAPPGGASGKFLPPVGGGLRTTTWRMHPVDEMWAVTLPWQGRYTRKATPREGGLSRIRAVSRRFSIKVGLPQSRARQTEGLADMRSGQPALSTGRRWAAGSMTMLPGPACLMILRCDDERPFFRCRH